MNTGLLKRTAIITAPYFPPDGGGLERYSFEASSRLSKKYDWRIVVITSGGYGGKILQKSWLVLGYTGLVFSLKFLTHLFLLVGFGEYTRF